MWRIENGAFQREEALSVPKHRPVVTSSSNLRMEKHKKRRGKKKTRHDLMPMAKKKNN